MVTEGQLNMKKIRIKGLKSSAIKASVQRAVEMVVSGGAKVIFSSTTRLEYMGIKSFIKVVYTGKVSFQVVGMYGLSSGIIEIKSGPGPDPIQDSWKTSFQVPPAYDDMISWVERLGFSVYAIEEAARRYTLCFTRTDPEEEGISWTIFVEDVPIVN